MITPEEAKQAYEKYGSKRKAAKELGVARSTFRRVLERSEPEPEDTDNQTLKLRKQEKIINRLNKELKKARDELLTNAEVRRYILDIKSLDDGSMPDWVAQIPEDTKDHNIPCAMWSDFHWAEKVKSSQVFGLNHYDVETAKYRLSKLVGNTFWLLDEHLAPRQYPGFVLNLGGDMVSGDIHSELTETNEQFMMPTLLDLYKNLRHAIQQMADKYTKLLIPCVYGNHGRTNKKPQHKDQAYKNFDWLLYHLLADYFSDNENIRFLIGDDDEVQYQVLNHVYRLTHGSQFRGGVGFIGPIAPITRGEHKKRIVSQSQDTVYDTLLLGHFHQCIWRPRTVVCGSLKGYDEFAADHNLEYEAPKQMMWLTDKNLGKVSPMEIWCDEPILDYGVQQFEQIVF